MKNIIICSMFVTILILYHFKIYKYIAIYKKESFSKYKYPTIYYINLKHRQDRLKHIVQQLDNIQYPLSKINRVDAIKHSNGSTGCGLSHIKALRTAMKNNNSNSIVIIMEDDFKWSLSNQQTKRILFNAIHNDIDWNVILLSCKGPKLKFHKYLQRVVSCQTASGYIIKVKYIPQLLNIWVKDMNFRLKYDIKINDPLNHRTCIDQSWKKLQHNKWFTTNPIIGSQIKSFSDIENKMVEYNV